MITAPNKRVETNRRPALPFDAGREFDTASCDPPSLSAAVAHSFRSVTMRTVFTAVLLSATALAAADLPPPGTYENVVTAVYVSPEQGQAVADLYDRFLELLAGRGIEAGANLPAGKDFCTETETHAIFSRSYYITQDELRGFSISIPKPLLRKKGGSYIVTARLQVAEVTKKQSIKIIVLKRSPNPAVQRTTGASRSAQDTNQAPSAAGSRR